MRIIVHVSLNQKKHKKFLLTEAGHVTCEQQKGRWARFSGNIRIAFAIQAVPFYLPVAYSRHYIRRNRQKPNYRNRQLPTQAITKLPKQPLTDLPKQPITGLPNCQNDQPITELPKHELPNDT